jgi:hypothetical protein
VCGEGERGVGVGVVSAGGAEAGRSLPPQARLLDDGGAARLLGPLRRRNTRSTRTWTVVNKYSRIILGIVVNIYDTCNAYWNCVS